MEKDDFYSTAHLFVAAIRIHEHRNNAPPSVEEISTMLSLSREKISLICHQLQEMEIVKAVKSPFGLRLFVRNHLKIEEIPKDKTESKLEHDLQKFKKNQKKSTLSMDSFRAKQEENKKKLFAEAEKKLKNELPEQE